MSFLKTFYSYRTSLHKEQLGLYALSSNFYTVIPIFVMQIFPQACDNFVSHCLADRTNGRAYATVLRPSVVVCDVMYCG